MNQFEWQSLMNQLNYDAALSPFRPALAPGLNTPFKMRQLMLRTRLKAAEEEILLQIDKVPVGDKIVLQNRLAYLNGLG